MTGDALPARIRLAPNVIFVEIDDGSARLLNMDGSFFALSKSGADLLRRALDGGVAAAVDAVAVAFGIERGRVDTDMRRLLNDLRQGGLIESTEHPSRTGRFAERAAGLFVGTALRLRAGSSYSALVALARVSFALFGWVATIRAFGRAAERRAGRVGDGNVDETIARIDAGLRLATANVPSSDCKERALSGWYLLTTAGLPSTLVVGIKLYPLAGHCWCEVGTRVVTDFEDRCRAYLPVARYGPAPDQVEFQTAKAAASDRAV